MPSHKESLQKRVAETERDYLATLNEANRLHEELTNERRAVADLDAKYEAACRSVAQGRKDDPAAILAERDRRRHRILGLESLEKEANTSFQEASAAHQTAQRTLQTQLDVEKREELEQAMRDCQAKVKAADDAMKAAQQELSAASWARTRFLRELELRSSNRA